MDTVAVLTRRDREVCPNYSGWLRGRCEHGNERWIRLSCKRRDCPVCGQVRKRRIAGRVAHGLRTLGDGAWFVGTFDYDIPKAEAVKVQNKFIQWLRRDLGMPVQYAATWELTKEGRLHLNLVISPWNYISQRRLSSQWLALGGGFVVWIERVTSNIAYEVTKLGNYMAKFEQQVQTGRGITYSQGWPRIPDDPTKRLGHIDWVWLSPSFNEAEIFEAEIDQGVWSEIYPAEYSLCGEHEACSCFEFVSKPLLPRCLSP